ncbi:hypothetical protein ACG33_14100 [Steroidobacter denitrificans]|uniref:Uncharacterized protein n=1 Tax=Steroidobacter denitrificans TaxID=465721 RepID=A0A127FEB2_STEDE|nr:hypothetical protein [Steroidobacter denitrificans]AMN48209.1 hypothetical protein ACG33_14100 [Steroidobacter denitrificans]
MVGIVEQELHIVPAGPGIRPCTGELGMFIDGYHRSFKDRASSGPVKSACRIAGLIVAGADRCSIVLRR